MCQAWEALTSHYQALPPTISACQTGDDAFSPKTWQHYGPLHNLTIEHCRFRARSGGIHFGASAWYDYVNVTIRDVVVMDAHSGLLAQVRGPGKRLLHLYPTYN